MEKAKIVECPYWIVNSKEEKEAVEQKTGKKWKDIGYNFPYIIGYEHNFCFQEENIKTIMEDCHDDKRNETLTYIRQNNVC